MAHGGEAGLARRACAPPGPGGRAPVVVLDTIGELARAYRLATLVFVGGSFTTRGGQNILEPAAQGKPVLFGPHMENFQDSVQVLLGRGGIQVADAEQLFRVLTSCSRAPDKLAELGALARRAVTAIRGASARNVGSHAGDAAPRGPPRPGAGARCETAAILSILPVIRYSALGDVVLRHQRAASRSGAALPQARDRVGHVAGGGAAARAGLPGSPRSTGWARRARTPRSRWRAGCAAASISPSTCRRR